MTANDWLNCNHWRPMLKCLSGRVARRKGMLYVCAGLRCIWDLLYDEASQQAIEVAERAADGDATDEEVGAAGWSAEVPTFGYDFEPKFIREHMAPGHYYQSVQRLLEMGVYSEADIAGDGPLGDERVV